MKISGSADSPDTREIYVIDDNSDVRRSLHRLFGSMGVNATSFRSAGDFLDDFKRLRPAPILLDIRMPEIDGLALMSELQRRESSWPVIVMTGYGEIPIAVKAMRLGAIEFLPKPFEVEAIEEALDLAYGSLQEKAGRERERDMARTRIDRLTQRERQVTFRLAEGMSNKEVARDLDLSVRTIEMHRGNAMKKLATINLVETIALLAVAGAAPQAARDQSSA